MVSWANDGSLPRMLEVAKSDPNKRSWIPELKDRMIGNINRLPENLRDDVKLKLYKTNPNVFNKDAEWLGTIGTAMNLMGRGEIKRVEMMVKVTGSDLRTLNQQPKTNQ